VNFIGAGRTKIDRLRMEKESPLEELERDDAEEKTKMHRRYRRE
jgi:hypothetical protein